MNLIRSHVDVRLFFGSINSLMLTALLLILPGCGRQSDVPDTPSSVSDEKSSGAAIVEETADETPEAAFVFEAQAYEASAEQLLAARLPIEQTTEGWVRLFDGHTMFGWVIAGEANWRIKDMTLMADRGQACLLTTTTRWSDFELELEYLAGPETNSGVFIRSGIDPTDPAIDCFEINIAPADNPFPTGSIVKRQKGETVITAAEQWHTMNVVCEGESIVVKINDEVTSQTDEATTPRSGYVGLQFRSGPIRFRNIRLRPIGMENLLDAELSQWKQYEDMPGEFLANEDGHLVVEGGKQQLESKESYGDFTLLADYSMDDPKSNSGIFFRSIPGDVMMGYECQVNNETVDDNPLQPADCGPGGIFRRQDARIVAGEPERWNSILLSADGSHFATWVNGLQVTDISDDRKPDENPRKGLRLEPGTLIVQGHDETTRATYRKIAVKTSVVSLETEPETPVED